RRWESVEEARNGSGFESESGFREAFTKVFGDPPSTAKRRDCLDSWMAERLGDPGARRAVGRANGMNMMSIIIPCHRVIRADGTLCGYGGRL
ncbi:MAG: methylated-DNA--[protein]-cysteine S-methyltransferase, partial [Chthoniobacterales bacterium]